jgi:hypothetical protein
VIDDIVTHIKKEKAPAVGPKYPKLTEANVDNEQIIPKIKAWMQGKFFNLFQNPFGFYPFHHASVILSLLEHNTKMFYN